MAQGSLLLSASCTSCTLLPQSTVWHSKPLTVHFMEFQPVLNCLYEPSMPPSQQQLPLLNTAFFFLLLFFSVWNSRSIYHSYQQHTHPPKLYWDHLSGSFSIPIPLSQGIEEYCIILVNEHILVLVDCKLLEYNS